MISAGGKHRCKGFTIPELIAGIFAATMILGIATSTFTNTLLDASARYNINNFQAYQIDPLQTLFKNIQGWSYQVYPDLASGELGGYSAAVPIGPVVRFTRPTPSSPEFLIVSYDQSQRAIIVHPLDTSGSSIRWSQIFAVGIDAASFDSSGGYLVLTCSRKIKSGGMNKALIPFLRTRTYNGETYVDYRITLNLE